MITVVPKIFFLGQPKMDVDGVRAWLSHIGGEEALACLDHVDVCRFRADRHRRWAIQIRAEIF